MKKQLLGETNNQRERSEAYAALNASRYKEDCWNLTPIAKFTNRHVIPLSFVTRRF